MHKERINSKVKVTHKASIEDLPDGTIFSNRNSAYLIFENKIYLWSFKGYHLLNTINLPGEVDVLTPRSIINAFKLGLVPGIHVKGFSRDQACALE